VADPTHKVLLTEKEIDQASKLAGLGLNMKQIASVIGVCKKTIERRMHDQPELVVAIEKGRAEALAMVSKTAYQMATSGKSPVSTFFWLKCKGGWSETDVDTRDKDNEYKSPVSLSRVV